MMLPKYNIEWFDKAAAFLESKEVSALLRSTRRGDFEQVHLTHSLALRTADRADDGGVFFACTVKNGQDIVGMATWFGARYLSVRCRPCGHDAVIDPAVPLLLCAEVVSRVPEEKRRNLTCITAPPGDANAFLKYWCTVHGPCRYRKSHSLRTMVLTRDSLKLCADGGPAGASLVQVESRMGIEPVLSKWFQNFHRDIGNPVPTLDDARSYVSSKISGGDLFVWSLEDGPRRQSNVKPVSIVGVCGAGPGFIRIAFVFTPRKWRGSGYATRSVSALCKLTIAGKLKCATAKLAGKIDKVVLFVDEANPVSTAVYLKVGFVKTEARMIEHEIQYERRSDAPSKSLPSTTPLEAKAS